jgi:hypothetical protein
MASFNFFRFLAAPVFFFLLLPFRFFLPKASFAAVVPAAWVGVTFGGISLGSAR